MIQSINNSDNNILDENTILFLSKDQPLGYIFETFGSVQIPMYSIRMKPENIKKLYDAEELIVDETLIYNFPDMDEVTKFVFTKKLEMEKGTDASWKDDQECPIEFQDFSDDEQEKRMKKEKREKHRKRRLEASMLEAMEVLKNEENKADNDGGEKTIGNTIGFYGNGESKNTEEEHVVSETRGSEAVMIGQKNYR